MQLIGSAVRLEELVQLSFWVSLPGCSLAGGIFEGWISGLSSDERQRMIV